MSGEKRFAAVIPAAGLSSRMGDFKPLLEFNGSTVIESAVSGALSCCDTAVIVLGKRAAELRELLQSRFKDRLIFAENPGYASTDMLTSVKIGVSTLNRIEPGVAGFFITPADMPCIPPDVYRNIISEFDRARDGALIPVTGGRRGHPPLITSRLIPDILAYDGGDGLRGFYRGIPVREIPIADTGILTDLDTPEDYRAAVTVLPVSGT